MVTLPSMLGIVLYSVAHAAWPFDFLNSSSREGSSLAAWIIAISILVSTIISILAFLGIAQSMQLRLWKNQVESRLRIIESYLHETESIAISKLKKLGVERHGELVKRIKDFFLISPVSIEPIDIIRRLEQVLRTGEKHIEKLVSEALPSGVDEPVRKNLTTILAIVNGLNTLYKYLRHLLLLGVKTRNAMLVAQVWMLIPFYLRIAKAYRDAAETIAKGLPIGDSAGPLVAYRLSRIAKPLSRIEEIAEDTVYGVYELDGRRVVIIKAKGPGSTVGRPGEAVEKLVKREDIAGGLSAIITVDAALKFEGEETGITAEGVGVAMGDPGPEKIRIERIAARLRVPLYAVAIKMGLEEAITAMSENVVKGVEDAINRVLNLIKERTMPGDTVIVIGVGNTIGISQCPTA